MGPSKFIILILKFKGKLIVNLKDLQDLHSFPPNKFSFPLITKIGI